jgi:hypothetical protein
MCQRDLTPWYEKIVQRGRKVFVLPRCASKYSQIASKVLPDGFEEMAISDEKELNVMHAFIDLQQLISDIGWQSISDEINLIKILLEAGHFAVSYVPLDQLLAGTVAIITSDNNMITKMLQEPCKAEKIETVVNMNGLEHAIPLIQYSSDGTSHRWFVNLSFHIFSVQELYQRAVQIISNHWQSSANSNGLC